MATLSEDSFRRLDQDSPGVAYYLICEPCELLSIKKDIYLTLTQQDQELIDSKVSNEEAKTRQETRDGEGS